MKDTGIVRRIDDLGRVVIPKETRKTFGIKEGDPLELWVDGESIVFRKYQPGCVFCGKPTEHTFAGKLVCEKCAKAMQKNEK